MALFCPEALSHPRATTSIYLEVIRQSVSRDVANLLGYQSLGLHDIRGPKKTLAAGPIRIECSSTPKPPRMERPSQE